LLNDANCIRCFTNASLADLLKIALLSQISAGGGGGGTPALPFNSVQFNNAGAFGGDADLTWNPTTNSLAIVGAANNTPLTITGYSLAGANAQSMVDLVGTWNTSGNPTALKVNIVNTLSGATSLLLDLQVDSLSKVSVSKAGLLTASTIAGLGIDTLGNGVFLANPTVANIGVQLWPSWGFGWSSILGDPLDVGLYRDAASVLALRAAAAAQTFRWYRTFTDAANYERGALQTAAGEIIVAAETAGTGTDDIDLTLTPAGVGLVRFGTHSAIGAETVQGFITIKDAGGTPRKLAVVA